MNNKFMGIADLTDGTIKDTQALHEFADSEFVADMIQSLHKINGGTRKLKDSSIQLRLQVLGAFNQVGWEAMGVRGIYYRVVSIYGLPKTEATYDKVQAEMVKMRRDGTLDYKYVVDGSRHTYGVETYSSTGEFLSDISHAYRRDIWSNSEYKLEVTVEKDSMRDILMPVTREYGIDLSPTSGFNSETAWYNLASRYKHTEKTPVLLMLTDHDTSGLNMVKAAELAFDRFGVDPILLHVGLKPKQIEEYSLLTRQDKSDPSFTNACELDAMTPQQAREMLTKAIKPFADEEAFRAEREQQKREQFELLKIAKTLTA